MNLFSPQQSRTNHRVLLARMLTNSDSSRSIRSTSCPKAAGEPAADRIRQGRFFFLGVFFWLSPELCCFVL